MINNFLRIVTRQSTLAFYQTLYIRNKLIKYYPNLKIKLIPIITYGDNINNFLIHKNYIKNLFTKELELALINFHADIAIHSMKDIPNIISNKLGLIIICNRLDPRDVFISLKYNSIESLPYGSIIGTSSLRRKCQILSIRSDLKIKNLRGNIKNRLKKLDKGYYDAIILAKAGLKRLNLQNRIKKVLEINYILPAIGQGAIGLEYRLNDIKTILLLNPLHKKKISLCINAERLINFYLNGNCLYPIGGYAELNEEIIWLRAIIGLSNGKIIIKKEGYSLKILFKELSKNIANSLLNYGAKKILYK